MNYRIVSIQHGDYREALQILASGDNEPYFGMRYSVGVTEELIRDNPHLIISLDAPSYSEKRGLGELVGLPGPKLPWPIPRRIPEYWKAMILLKKIDEFRPTHVLLRTGLTPFFSLLLRRCRARQYNTLVVFANFLSNDNPRSKRFHLANTEIMNEPFVFRVGNHRWPATQSLIDSGLDPAKAVAWDTPGQREARDYPVKSLSAPPFLMVYAGSISFAKGVGDLIDAAKILHSRGIPFHLRVIGSGDDLATLKEQAASLPDGLVEFMGRIPNREVFESMRDATLVVVPSRHSFTEGMPYTLAEGLASRSPLIVSDHPVLVRAFEDGEGLRFFKASDPSSLANVAQAILADPVEYRRLSETTVDALDRITCSFSFGDLLNQWKQSYSDHQAQEELA